MSTEIKAILVIAGIFGGAIAIPAILEKLNDRRELDNDIKKAEIEAEANIKKAEIEASYPPEYWQAKEAEAKANAEVKKAQIESDERLKLDARNREEEELKAIREFEKNAPDAYWEHKRVEEEEKTKRELNAEQEKTAREMNKQRYETEQRLTSQNQELIRNGVSAAERAIRTLSYNRIF